MRRSVVLAVLAVALGVVAAVGVRAQDGPAAPAAAANRSPREEREARDRLLAERRESIVAAVTEARTEDALRLLDEHLRAAQPGSDEYRSWSDDCRLFDRLLEIRRDAAGADHERRERCARDVLRAYYALRPERVFETTWEQMHRTPPDGVLPRFFLPETVVSFAPEIHLRAEGPPGLTPACRLFRLLRPEAVEVRGSGGTAVPERTPHRFDPADLVEIDREIVWGPPEARSSTTTVADRSATLRLDAPGTYVLRQEEDGIRYDQPIDIPTFRLDVRSPDRPGWPHTVMAVDHATGRGVGDVEVTFLADDRPDAGRGPLPVALGHTDTRGILSVVLPATGRRDRLRIEGRRGGERHRLPIGGAWGEHLVARPAEGDPLDRQPFFCVTTDQPLYRPGDTVRYRAVVRDAGGGLIAPPDEPVRVEIRDADGRLCHAADHRWSRFGSLSGTWTLPGESDVGTFSVAVTGPPARMGVDIDPTRSAAIFEVADVRVPEFAVRVVPGPEPDTAIVRAECFTGGAVTDADVRWRVVAIEDDDDDHRRRPRSFEQLSPLDDPRAWLVDARIDAEERLRAARPEDAWVSFVPGQRRQNVRWGERTVAEGIARTGADGTALVAWAGRADRPRPPQRVRVMARVRDASRLAADGRAEIVSRGGPLRLEVGTDRLFTLPDEPLEVRLRASRPDGTPVEGVEVTLQGLLDTQNGAGAGSEAPPSHREFLRRTLRTDARGRARIEARVPEAGRVRWRAEAIPPGGGPEDSAVARADLWSAGGSGRNVGWVQDEDTLFGREHVLRDAPGNVARRPATAAFPLETEDRTQQVRITPDRFAYAAGESIRLLVRGVGPSGHVVAGIETRTSRREATFEIRRPMEVIELPVTAEDRGLATIWVRSWGGWEFAGDERQVFIHPEKHLLDVVVKADGGAHRPGGRASIDVEVRGHDGAGRHAEVELALLDEALASLVDAPPVHPLVALDPIQAVRGSRSSRVWMTFAAEPGRPDRLAGRPFDGAGARRAIEETSSYRGDRGDLGWSGPAVFITAGADDAVAAAEEEPAEPDAPREGGVVTGADGRARVTIALPERSTRYRLVARAVTRGGEAGVGETTFVVRRPLEVSLVAPRFLHVGDRSTAGVIVSSALDRTTDVTVRCRAPGATRVERMERMQPGERRWIEWDLEATAAGPMRLEAEAAAGDGAAAATLDLPVRPAAVEHRAVVAGGSSRMAQEPLEGEIHVPGDASEVAIDVEVDREPIARTRQRLWQTLNEIDLHRDDFGGRSFGWAVAALRDLVAAGFAGDPLERLARDKAEILLPGVVRTQHPDGGWRTDFHQPSPDLTAVMLGRLLAARDAGVHVDHRVIDDAVLFLRAAGRFDPDGDRIAPRARGARLPAEAPLHWALDVNGEEAIVETSRSARLKTRLIRPGLNTLSLRTGQPGMHAATVVVHSLTMGPAQGVLANREPAWLRRTIERRVEADAGTEERWEPIERGGSVSVRDRLRVVLECSAREGVTLDAPLGAGLEPVVAHAGPFQPGDRPDCWIWQARSDRILARTLPNRPPGTIAVEVRPTLPGGYLLPPAAMRPQEGDAIRAGIERFTGAADHLTEPFEIVVEE